MRLHIRSDNVPHSDALHGHARRRLRAALDRVVHRVSRVAVQLLDVNGPRGGVDKRCRVRVEMAGDEPVIIEETRPCMYEAVDHSVNRARRVVFDRIRQHHRSRRRRRSALRQGIIR